MICIKNKFIAHFNLKCVLFLVKTKKKSKKVKREISFSCLKKQNKIVLTSYNIIKVGDNVYLQIINIKHACTKKFKVYSVIMR